MVLRYPALRTFHPALRSFRIFAIVPEATDGQYE